MVSASHVGCMEQHELIRLTGGAAARPLPVAEPPPTTQMEHSLAGRDGTLIPDQVYRCPQDLAVTPLKLRRVLIIGSCLVMEWPDFIKTATPGCPCDYLVFNDGFQC
jgi:hypothetical protein